MYNGVNDENNESSFNSDENLYHYSYSKDQAPQPGQPDPSQTSWQPAPRPEPQAAQEDQTSCTTGDYQDEPRIPKTNGKSFWKKTGTKVTALVLCLSLIHIFIVKYIATGVTSAANWLASLASKLDAVVIVALITGCVSIVGVLISSIVAKRIEYKRSRQEYLAKKREEPYGQFVDMVYKIQQNTKKGDSYTEAQMLKDLSQFSKQITLWGSSRVVNKWVKFRENGTNPELAQKNLLLLEDIMNEMRKDLGLRKTKKGNLLAFFVSDIKKAIKSMK